MRLVAFGELVCEAICNFVTTALSKEECSLIFADKIVGWFECLKIIVADI